MLKFQGVVSAAVIALILSVLDFVCCPVFWKKKNNNILETKSISIYPFNWVW